MKEKLHSYVHKGIEEFAWQLMPKYYLWHLAFSLDEYSNNNIDDYI